MGLHSAILLLGGLQMKGLKDWNRCLGLRRRVSCRNPRQYFGSNAKNFASLRRFNVPEFLLCLSAADVMQVGTVSTASVLRL